ncbi:arylsulfatase I isoform X3 [Sitodiplosis mosellana]|nr:arylsulfatase I isoform X3 [Sitodiplosis mosellana]XP_055316310.1 arylsulfatase I isoform X3 [Sitodiplosis mosellana]
MTGKYPIHTGMQHTVLYAAEPRGLPLTEKILPQYLRELGYKNHCVGKWHLGHFKREYTPLHRGFDSHIGYWTGHHDYFDHTAFEQRQWGFDIRRGMDVAYDLHGQYTTDIITNESVRIVRSHNTSIPLFLYIAHAAVHSGNPYNPLPAPDSTTSKFTHISDFARRKYAAMMTHLDYSVGAVVHALSQNNMLNDSIIIFSTDNGGPAEGFNLNAASNWPLRGVKNTLWEGGVRGAALLFSPKIVKKHRVSNQTMHIADWLPTLFHVAGGNVEHLNATLDGKNMWSSLSEDTKSNRTEILHNIDDIYGSASLTVGEWKVHKGTNYNGAWDQWYGPAGIRSTTAYNANAVSNCPAGQALNQLNLLPTVQHMRKMRTDATVDCLKNQNSVSICRPLEKPCLFNVNLDPCEQNNLADESFIYSAFILSRKRHPEILNSLLERLNAYNETALLPANLPLDPNGDPRFFDNTWTNFGDFSKDI